VLQPLLDNGMVDNVSLHTYSRELERYGADTMEETEALFTHDSLAVLRFLALLEETEEADRYRLLFALRATDMLLDDFGLSLAEKQSLAGGAQAAFFREHGGTPELQKKLNEKYRIYGADILSHLGPERDAENGIGEATTIFGTRSAMSRNAVTAIRNKLHEAGSDRLPSLLQSYIHMFINRLFPSRQRRHELVVFHFLSKYYAALSAIRRREEAVVANRPERLSA
jgi:thiopeptide-type bacteriocin biosynthesis protein